MYINYDFCPKCNAKLSHEIDRYDDGCEWECGSWMSFCHKSFHQSDRCKNIWYRISLDWGLEKFGIYLTQDEKDAKNFFESTRRWGLFSNPINYETAPLVIYEVSQRINGKWKYVPDSEVINMDWTR